MPTNTLTDFYSAVFFDMDGLLVDSEPLWLESETEMMAQYGYHWLESDQAACLGGPLDRVGDYMSGLIGGKRDGRNHRSHGGEIQRRVAFYVRGS